MSEIRADKLHNVTGDNDSGIDLSTNDVVAIKIAASEKARVDSSGNLLVGQSSEVNPASANVVGASLQAGGQLNLTKDGGTSANFNRKTSDGSIINFRKDGTTVGTIGVNSGLFYIGQGDTTLMFSDAGNQLLPRGTDGASRDNAIDLGSSSNRLDDIFASNGTIQTSDRNDKQDIEELSDAEKRVAVVAKGLMRKFRWKDKVAEKGDNARTHFGIIAQDLQDAFKAEGLDASDYAMFCSDTWWELDGETYDTEEKAPSDATKKTRLGVRYSELLAFIISAI